MAVFVWFVSLFACSSVLWTSLYVNKKKSSKNQADKTSENTHEPKNCGIIITTRELPKSIDGQILVEFSFNKYYFYSS